MTPLRWLIRLLIIAGLLGLLASWRDPLTLIFQDWQFSIPLGVALFSICVVFIFFVLLDRLMRRFGLWGKLHARHKTHKARAMMLHGFALLDALDIDGAKALAVKIKNTWRDDVNDPFLLAFQARLAEEDGDFELAQTYYDTLSKTKEARPFITARLNKWGA